MTRIYAVETEYLPHVFVNGEILIKMTQYIPKNPKVSMENSYAATGMSIVVPMSDYHYVDNLERSPAVIIVVDNNIAYHIPTGVNTEC